MPLKIADGSDIKSGKSVIGKRIAKPERSESDKSKSALAAKRTVSTIAGLFFERRERIAGDKG